MLRLKWPLSTWGYVQILYCFGFSDDVMQILNGVSIASFGTSLKAGQEEYMW